MKRHLIGDRRTEIAAGLLLLGAGFALLHDAYDGRGLKKPLIFGPFLPW